MPGLLLVRAAVQRHGGSVEIESAENQGCTVILVLPYPASGAARLLLRNGTTDH